MGHIQPAPGTEQYNYQLAHWGDDVRAQNIAGSLITAFAATILVTTRIWCQLKYNHKLFAADWLILVAWPFAAIEAVCTVLRKLLDSITHCREANDSSSNLPRYGPTPTTGCYGRP